MTFAFSKAIAELHGIAGDPAGEPDLPALAKSVKRSLPIIAAQKLHIGYIVVRDRLVSECKDFLNEPTVRRYRKIGELSGELKHL